MPRIRKIRWRRRRTLLQTMFEEHDAHEKRSGSTITWVLYNILLVLLFPVIIIYLLWRLVSPTRRLAGFEERAGAIDRQTEGLRGDDPVVWVHAVSAGEVAAVTPVIRQIRIAEPLTRIALSTITATGREMVESRSIDPDALFYFPFDVPGIVNRVLDTVKPDLLVLVETEIWPNLLQAAARRGVRIIVVNGRISDHSFRRARFFKPLMAWMLSNIDLICAQSQPDADRFIALGAAGDRVIVTGNSKFDEQFPAVPDAEISKYRHDFGFGHDDPVLLAASTHEGEEELTLKAFTRLRIEHPSLQLIIAPRHPERGGRVERLVQDHGYASYRRSRAHDAGGTDPLAPEGGPQVCVAILDTIGELAHVYAVSVISFVGNSLVPGGGHNVLQPIAQGKPALFGPHMQNFRDIAAICLREEVGFEVADLEAFVSETKRLLNSEGDLALIKARGPAVIAKYAGASRRNADRIIGLLNAMPADTVDSESELEG